MDPAAQEKALELHPDAKIVVIGSFREVGVCSLAGGDNIIVFFNRGNRHVP